MTTPTKPLDGDGYPLYPDFAMVDTIDPSSGQTNVVEPNATKKNVGWVYNEKPPRQFFNWLGRLTSLWTRYLDYTLDLAVQAVNSAHNRLDNLKASQVANDSTVAGTTVANALNQLLSAVTYTDGRVDYLLPIGTVLPYLGISTPSADFLYCDGSTFSAVAYPTLATLLGGTTLPDLRGKFMVGYNASDSDYNAINKAGGEKTHSLSVAELASHTHEIRKGTNGYDLNTLLHSPGGINAGAVVPYGAIGEATYETSWTSESRGSGTAHENRPPFSTVQYIIKAK